jgi:hypothetical protein
MNLRVDIAAVTVLALLMVTVPQVGCVAEDAHIVRLTVSTDSDWSHLTFSGFGSVLLHESTVTRGPGSGVAVYAEGGEIHVWVSKESHDQTLVQLDVKALVLGTGQPFTLGFLVEFLWAVAPLLALSTLYTWRLRGGGRLWVAVALNALLFSWVCAGLFPFGSF